MIGIREKIVLFTNMHIYRMSIQEILRHQESKTRIELVTLRFIGYTHSWIDYWRQTYGLGDMEKEGRPYDAFRINQIHEAITKGVF